MDNDTTSPLKKMVHVFMPKHTEKQEALLFFFVVCHVAFS